MGNGKAETPSAVEGEKRSVLITGGTRGIGRATARRFAREGWNVGISGRTLESVRKALAEFQKEGLAIEGKSADARKEDDVRELVEHFAARFSRLDVVVNNAGIGEFAAVDQVDPKDFRAIVETNLYGPFYAIHYAAPLMKKAGGGFIVNVGSLASVHPMLGGAAYNASKFGLLGLSSAAMLDLRHDGVRVAIVMPGSVATEFGGAAPEPEADAWKLSGDDVAEAIYDVVRFPDRAIPSRIELRPTRPPRR